MDLYNYSLHDIHAGLRNGSCKTADIVNACINNYQNTEATLQAYKFWNGENLVKSAIDIDKLFAQGLDLGPLMGMPIAIKDLYAVTNMPIFAGSSKEISGRWRQSGPLVSAMQKQLALVTGKTHTVEFAFGGIGINQHWGTPVNPWGKEHYIPGGSSSGAGVALVQGSCLISMGTDTAGSVRIPAALTGNVGLKTTYGRWPADGIVPLSSSLDTPGVLARSVADVVFAFEAIESSLLNIKHNIKPVNSLAGLRFASFDEFFLDGADDAVLKIYQQSLDKLKKLGVLFDDIELPGCANAYSIFQQGGLSAPELSAFIKTNLPEHMDQLDPVVRLRLEGADSLSSVDYLIRKHVLDQASATADKAFADIDILVSPTIAINAPKVADLADTKVYGRTNMMVLRNTSIANLLGLCAITIPIGKDANGIPVGLQLMSAADTEADLLAIALKVESHFGLPKDILGQP